MSEYNHGKKTLEQFEQELIERFPFNSIKILEFTKASGPIKYQCLSCGKIYYKSRANHLYENKTLCQKCYTARDSECRNKFINYLNNRPDLQVISPIGSTIQPVRLKCLKCNHEFEVLISNFITSDFHSCPNCGKNGAPVPQSIYEQRMKESGKEGYTIISYKNITSPMLIRHDCGFIFKVKPDNFLKNRGCPKCFKQISKGEQKIINFLEKNQIHYEYQKHFTNDAELGTKSYDFYLPQHNLLIEYQGEQHYRPMNFWGGEEKFQQQIINDNIKRNFAQSRGIKLLEIPYSKYNNIENILSFLEGSTTTSVDSSESKEKLK